MQQQYLDPRSVSDAFGPYLEFTFGGIDLHHPHTSRLYTGISIREVFINSGKTIMGTQLTSCKYQEDAD
jgi:hypothetical protein